MCVFVLCIYYIFNEKLITLSVYFYFSFNIKYFIGDDKN